MIQIKCGNIKIQLLIILLLFLVELSLIVVKSKNPLYLMTVEHGLMENMI